MEGRSLSTDEARIGALSTTDMSAVERTQKPMNIPTLQCRGISYSDLGYFLCEHGTEESEPKVIWFRCFDVGIRIAPAQGCILRA